MHGRPTAVLAADLSWRVLSSVICNGSIEQGVPVAGDHHGELAQFVANDVGCAPDAGTTGPPHAGLDEKSRKRLL